VIKKRLKEHFRKHFLQLEKAHRGIIRKGIALAIVGFAFMVGATFLYQHNGNNFLSSFLTILLEPSGWFMVWYGLDQIFYVGKQKKPDFQFYDKMDKAEIKFESY
jgi:predicted phage tail protein